MTVSLLLGAAGDASAQTQTTAPPLLIRDARVFDGERVIGIRDVLVRDGRIAEIGTALGAPTGAQLVEAGGRTLLPGFIDAHTHAFGDALREAIVFGVTTELDMFTDWQEAKRLRAEQATSGASQRADLFSAGTLVTAPGGHGTQFGLSIPTLSHPDSAPAFVDARIAEGSDWIKIVHDDGHPHGVSFPTVDVATMRAAIEAAHRHGRLAVVHIAEPTGARAAIASGADGLVHLFMAGTAHTELAALIAASGAFVIPTLSVLRSAAGVSGAALREDERLVRYLSPMAATTLGQSFPDRDGAAAAYTTAEAMVRLLRDCGVPILAGTDAGNPGTAHGASMHGEVALLVDAGLEPVEALAAATSVPARAFRLADRGRIAPGLRADLLLVNGDPTQDITATRDIVHVWKGGVAVDREAFARNVAEAVAAVAAPPPGIEHGLISDFESGTLEAAFGSPFMESPDSYAGGKSTGRIEVVAGGANGSAHSLSISGTISDAVPYAWYGAMWSPGSMPMTPADLSSKRELRFSAKGDGRRYRVMVFAQSMGMMPATRTFVTGPEWSEVVMSWADFGTDGSDISGIVFTGGPQPGPFEFRVDDVRLR